MHVNRAEETAGLLMLQSWLPDSPRWLLLSGKGAPAASAALARARGKYGTNSVAIDAEIAGIEESIAETRALDEDIGVPTLTSYLNGQ